MKCSLCGYEFDEEAAGSACAGCSINITNSCSLAMCPNCGFEMPKKPQISRLLKKVGVGKDE